MRMVLSAQISRVKGAPYISLSQVLKTIPTLPAPVAQVDSETAALKGYRLRMTVSDDKQHFQASLTPETGCGRSWFGSEQSLIYVGRVLGCATD